MVIEEHFEVSYLVRQVLVPIISTHTFNLSLNPND
jgi:hypothetical protein